MQSCDKMWSYILILCVAAVFIGGDCALYGKRFRGPNDSGVDGFNDVAYGGNVREANKEEAEELMRSAKGKFFGKSNHHFTLLDLGRKL